MIRTPAYHPRAQRHRDRGRHRLRVRDASAMAIGGMIGGGIFSVLGVTVRLAGHAAVLCFVLAGALAALTARAYAGLARSSGTSGGPDAFLRSQGHVELAALTSWFLVMGYVLALGVYAFTFGHYVESVTSGGPIVARGAAMGLLVVFLALNVAGVGASSLTEDAIVLVKLLVLGVVATVGVLAWSGDRLAPLTDVGAGGIFVGAASVFIAYEGFELLSYDYDDIEDPDRNLPRALYLSVAAVCGVYVLVTLGSQMLVPDEVLVAQREVAFATVGEEALGVTGRALAVAGAVLATASAVNATLFSTSRLMRDLTDSGELPAWLGRQRGGIPVTALWVLAGSGLLFAMVPGVDEIVAFGSLTFLTVFALVNHLHARTATRRRTRLVSHGAALACATAVVVVLEDLARNDRPALAMVVVVTTALVATRLLHRFRRARDRMVVTGDRSEVRTEADGRTT